MTRIKPYFRQAEFADFDQLESKRLANSSYKHIAFPLGCSRSEFQMNVDNREITLFKKGHEENEENIGFIRIKSVMPTHIYLDFFCLKEPDYCVQAISQLLKHLTKSYNTNKFFIQLLEHEEVEYKILETLNFNREASLSQHIWLNNYYQDVYIYGSPLYV